MNWMYAFRDLAQHRTRVGFAVSGIAVAIFLLTTVGMLGDSVSYSYVDYASQSEGKVDYELWGGRIDYASVEATIKANPNLAILEDFLPRGSQYGWSTVDYRALNPSTNRSILTYHVGIDIERETSSVQGPFLHANSTPYTGGLDDGECILTTAVASRIGIEAGQVVTFLRIYYTSDDKTTISSQVAINYTVNAVVNLNAKFGENYENSLFVPLETFNSIYGPDWRPPGTCDHLAINLATPETYYDSRDIPGTILKLRDIGEDIQNTIGFYNTYSWYGPTDQTYFIYMPRIAILEFEQYVNIGMSIILLFVTVLSLVISAVLINGILSTSVEEKIREFGVFRVLGAHRHFPVKLTVIQAFILASTGTAIGIGTAYVAVSYGLLPLIVDLLDFAGGNVVAILGPQTLLLTIGAGIGISMVAGIAPAMKVSRMSILGAINPYRQESVGTRMVKEASLNLRYVTVGVVMSGIAGFVLYIVPQILLTLDIGLIVAVLVILLTVFLMGASLVGLGFLPVVQNIIRRVFTTFTRKTREIVRISLVRYTRRNVTTVIMFSISFSFITLVSTLVQTQSAQNIGQARNSIGGDLCIDSRRQWIAGFDPEHGLRVPDQAFAEELLNIEGIVKASTILATDLELSRIRGTSYSLTISDSVGYKTNGVNGVAVDQNFIETTFMQYAVFTGGDATSSFEALFNGENTVIVSSAIAISMRIEMGESCFLVFEWGDGESQTVEFTVVGIVDNLPGITTVQKRPDSAAGAAVVMSQDNFKKYFQLPAGNFYTSRIFLKIEEQYQDRSRSQPLETYIEETYENEYMMIVRNAYRAAGFAQDIFAIVETLFLVILSFAVVISLFGLISAAYSTILERTREVGIIQTLGLRNKAVTNMFTVENQIIMFSAAINGAIIGLLLIWLFYLQIGAFQSFPLMSVFQIPWNTIGLELLIASVICVLAMVGLLKRVQKMEIMEIFRKTM